MIKRRWIWTGWYVCEEIGSGACIYGRGMCGDVGVETGYGQVRAQQE
jgi:hypothetical protein